MATSDRKTVINGRGLEMRAVWRDPSYGSNSPITLISSNTGSPSVDVEVARRHCAHGATMKPMAHAAWPCLLVAAVLLASGCGGDHASSSKEDASTPEAGPPDSSPPEAGGPEAGQPDGQAPDAGVPDGTIPGTTDPALVGYIRGHVIGRSTGTAVPGVAVTVLNHPEFGQVATGQDGWFEVAVNAGGLSTVQLTMGGYLPVQRQAQTAWHDYTVLGDIALTALDVPTAVSFGAMTAQVAKGSPVPSGSMSLTQDPDGTRQAAIYIPPGTTTDQPALNVGTVHLRATELTVGANGRIAMPADLPANSAYTYAVALTLDEANGQTVHFNQPVSFYVDDFLGFKGTATTGTPVAIPSGYYDPTLGAWVAGGTNGRLVTILSTTGGIAQLDVDSDGVADTGSKLTALGITTDEQTQLGTALYPGAANKSLWRVQLPHFTTWDCNWPYDLPEGATPPGGDPPQDGDPAEDPCEQSGSIIECQSQILAEEIPVVGTPWVLRYQSERQAGREVVLSIPITGAAVPPPTILQSIVVNVTIAGNQWNLTEPAATPPNQSVSITWNGLDVHGNRTTGPVPATIQVGYVYGGVYESGPSSAPSRTPSAARTRAPMSP